MALKMTVVDVEQVRETIVRKSYDSALRDEIERLVRDEIAPALQDKAPGVVLAQEFVGKTEDEPARIIGFAWMDFSDDLRDAVTVRQNHGGLKSIADNINRNFGDEYRVRAVLTDANGRKRDSDAGKTSGRIYFIKRKSDES